MKNSVLAVVGIDTGIGKSIATGMMARFLLQKNIKVVTQKMVQTGCEKISEDIVIHRKLMGIPLSAQDKQGVTCPYLFKHPASPHLAAQMENRSIDPEQIHRNTLLLKDRFDMVLLEGAGGLQVPLTRQTSILDYIQMHRFPVVLVTCSRLGSINHTLLSLEALQARQIKVAAIVYNTYPKTDPFISADSITIIKAFVLKNRLNSPIIEMGQINMDDPGVIDFRVLLEP